LFSKGRDRIIPSLMLMNANGGGYLPKKGIYDDRVDATCHYINLYGADWKNHTRFVKK